MRYNGSIKGVLNNSSPTSSPGMWSINDVQENRTDVNWPSDNPDGADSFDYLLVGGGGGGGGGVSSNAVGGGGGGGQVVSGTSIIDTSSPYSITIGNGGSYGSGFDAGSNGSPTNFSNPSGFSVEALGGGAGSGYNDFSGPHTAANAGGGGGGNGAGNGSPGTVYNGGDGAKDGNNRGGGGGGAGAGGAGSNGIAGGNGGAGGPGLLSDITGTNVYYGAGGGGGSNAGSAGAGGNGVGGGGGSASSGNVGDNGNRSTVRSTGAGGGGAAVYGSGPTYANGGGGENGCLILRYPNMYDLHMDNWESGSGPNAPINLIIKDHYNGIDKVAIFMGRNQSDIYWVKSSSAKEF